MPDHAVLVTGCSSGIGEATARRLARAGRPVWATARRPETLAGLERDGCRTLALDVTDERSMRAAVDAVEREHGAVDVLVNNAGYSLSGALETVGLDAARRQFETNVFGPMRLTQLVLPAMRRARRGKIVNLSSMGANFTFPGGGWYHATKHALDALSDALRFEVAGFGIDVIIVQPGIIRTGFAEAATAALSEGTTAAADGSPYEAFNAGVAASTRSVYEKGPLARLGGGPDAVAAVIEKAITAKRPRARYRVTPSAHALVLQRRLMPDRAWDLMLRTQFRRPR